MINNNEFELEKPFEEGLIKTRPFYKKYWFIILIIILAVILLFFFLKEEVKEEKLSFRLQEVFDASVKNCIENSAGYECLALANDNPSYCDQSSYREDCYGDYYYLIALKNQDYLVCDQLGEEDKYFCKTILSKDLSGCSIINDSYLRISCEILTNDNIEVCNQLQNEMDIVDCKNMFYYTKAFTLSDINFCTQISLDFAASNPYYERELCNSLLNSYCKDQALLDCYDHAYNVLANAEFNYTMCHFIINNSLKESCLKEGEI